MSTDLLEHIVSKSQARLLASTDFLLVSTLDILSHAKRQPFGSLILSLSP